MTWFRVDDSFPSHPKTRRIPRSSRMAVIGTWTTLGTYAARHLTDGRIAADDVIDEGGTRAHAAALVDAGLWHPPGSTCGHPETECPGAPPEGHYQFHDWYVYQRSRAQVTADREAAAERQRLARERAKAKRDAERESRQQSPDQSQGESRRDNGVTHGVSHGPPDPTRPDPSVPTEQMTEPAARSSAIAIPDHRPDIDRLCQHLADAIEANGSKRPRIGKRWHDAARLLLDADGRTEAQVHAAIDWCQSDEFWRGNVLSMPTLREKYDQLRLQAMRGQQAPGPTPRASPGDRALALIHSIPTGSEVS